MCFAERLGSLAENLLKVGVELACIQNGNAMQERRERAL